MTSIKISFLQRSTSFYYLWIFLCILSIQRDSIGDLFPKEILPVVQSRECPAWGEIAYNEELSSCSLVNENEVNSWQSPDFLNETRQVLKERLIAQGLISPDPIGQQRDQLYCAWRQWSLNTSDNNYFKTYFDKRQQESTSPESELDTLWQMLKEVCGEDYQMPTDPNQICDLENSDDSKDALVYCLLRLIAESYCRLSSEALASLDPNDIASDPNIVELTVEDLLALAFSDPNAFDEIIENEKKQAVYESVIFLASEDPNQPIDPNQQNNNNINPLPEVYVESPITQSVIWDPNHIYRITQPVVFEGVGVQHIILPGTIVVFGEEGQLVYRNGAFLKTGLYGELSEANPDYPNTKNPVLPVFMISDILGEFTGYPGAILVEETASAECRLNNLYIEGCWVGIEVQRELNYPILGNFFFTCRKPIISRGHFNHQIVNNQIWYFGLYGESPADPDAGIEVFTDPADANSVTLPCSVMIAHNTIHDGGAGIIVHGHSCPRCMAYTHDPNDPNVIVPVINHHDPNTVAPEVYCVNNITTMSEITAYGFYDGAIKMAVVHPGLGANQQEVNILMEFIQPVWTYVNPYADVKDYRQLFLKSDSVFVDAGLGTISELPFIIGTTTSIQFYPDEKAADLGVHYTHSVPNTNQTYRSTDLNRDGWTNEHDLLMFTSGWLAVTRVQKWPGDPNLFHIDPNSISYKSDFNWDGIVDMSDFVMLANNYGRFSEIPAHPDFTIIPQDTGDNLSGSVEIKLNGYVENSHDIYLKIGNDLIGKFEDHGDGYTLTLPTNQYGNGRHLFQVISYDEPNNVTLSCPQYFSIDNNVYYMLNTLGGYESFISGFWQGETEPNILLMDLATDQVLWDGGSISSGGFGFSVSTDLITTGMVAAVQVIKYPEAGTPEWIDVIGKPLVIPDPNDPNYCNFTQRRALLILPYPDLVNARLSAIREIYKTFQMKNLPTLTLYHMNANTVNVRRGLNLPNVNYVYILTHANTVTLSGGRAYSVFQLHDTGVSDHWYTSDYEKVYWRLGRNTPNDTSDDDIPSPAISQNGNSAWDWGLYNSGKLKIVFFDGCKSAQSDMLARTFGIYSQSSYANNNQVFIGWVNAGKVTGSGYPEFVAAFWKNIRNYSVYQALNFAISSPEAGSWGDAPLNIQYLMPNPEYANILNLTVGGQ